MFKGCFAAGCLLLHTPIIDESKEVDKRFLLSGHIPRCTVLDKCATTLWVILIREDKSNSGIRLELLQILDRFVVFLLEKLVELRNDVDGHAGASVVLLDT